MSRTFAYCRVSTAGQTTENQVQEIAGAGFAVTPQRTIAETVSGSVAATERKCFSALLNRLESTDVLIVTKLALRAGDHVEQLPRGSKLSDQPSIHHANEGLLNQLLAA